MVEHHLPQFFLAESGFLINQMLKDKHLQKVADVLLFLQKRFGIEETEARASFRICDENGYVVAPTVELSNFTSAQKLFVFVKDKALVPNLLPVEMLNDSENSLKKSENAKAGTFSFPQYYLHHDISLDDPRVQKLLNIFEKI